MLNPIPVTIHEATPDDLPIIENLMQFYNYDLSQWCLVDFAEHGLYAIRSKRDYWATPSVRPYVARVNDELAGFAVVDADVTDEGSDFNMGYFFVARRYQRAGVGSQMVDAVFRRHPGHWEIYHLTSNLPACRFWPKAIVRAGATDPLIETTRVDDAPAVRYKFQIDPTNDNTSHRK